MRSQGRKIGYWIKEKISFYSYFTFTQRCLLKLRFNHFLAGGSFCGLLITFANSLDKDQNQHNVGPDLGPNLTF